MGVDLSDILETRPLGDGEMNGKVIALDAFNVLYQFLSSIRQPDGTPLMDQHGRVTSHIQGILSRSSNLIRDGIRPVYVFDGKMLERKRETVEARKDIRAKAEEDWAQAIEDGDTERAAIKARQSSRLTNVMIEEAKLLLDMLGIPWIEALFDGEAQASYMCTKGDVWAVGSQDFDCMLLGSPRLIRNLGFSGRRRLPRGGYVKVEPVMLELEKVLNNLELTREQLVDIAILVGTDFNEGVKGIGPKTALKLVKKHGRIEDLEKKVEIEDIDELRNIFLEPKVTDDYQFDFKRPDRERALDYLCNERGFRQERVEIHLDVITEGLTARQKTLDSWF